MVMAADVDAVDLYRLIFLKALGCKTRVKSRMDELLAVLPGQENAVGVGADLVQVREFLQVWLAM